MDDNLKDLSDYEKMKYYYKKGAYYFSLGNKLKKKLESEDIPGQIHLNLSQIGKAKKEDSCL